MHTLTPKPNTVLYCHLHPARIDYQVDESRATEFYTSIRSYYPGLPDESLQPDYAGIRPKLSRAQGSDFIIQVREENAKDASFWLFGTCGNQAVSVGGMIPVMHQRLSTLSIHRTTLVPLSEPLSYHSRVRSLNALINSFLLRASCSSKQCGAPGLVLFTPSQQIPLHG